MVPKAEVVSKIVLLKFYFKVSIELISLIKQNKNMVNVSPILFVNWAIQPN